MAGELLQGVGTLLGGAGGLVGGLANLGYNIYQNNQDKKARAAASQQIDNWYTANAGMLDEYQRGMNQFSTPQDAQTYQQLKNSYNPNDYIYNFDEFDDSKYNVKDYLNQNYDRILQDVGKASQATAAGAALGHSSGALDASIAAQTQKSEDLYNNAYNRMNTEKNFDYTRYQNYIQNMQNKLTLQQQGVQNQMNNLRSDLQFDQQQNADLLQSRMNLSNAAMQAKANITV